MTSLEEIKREWEISDDFPVEDERVVSAFCAIEEEIGNEWFDNRKQTGLGKRLIAIEAVGLGEALLAAKKIGAQKLLNKLKLEWDSEELQQALGEADVIVKLLPLSQTVRYEPKIDGTRKKPDLVQHIGGDRIQYEVFCPETSADERVRTAELGKLAEDIDKVFESGSLDVYLLTLDLDNTSKKALIDEVKRISTQTAFAKSMLRGTAFLAFDPRGSVTLENQEEKEKREILPDGKVLGGCLFHERDRSQFYRKELDFKRGWPGLISFTKSDKPNAFTNFKLLRLFRPALDVRVFQKVVDESAQLLSTMPSIVVVIASAMGVVAEDWVDIVAHAFDSGIYTRPSAVWLRVPHMGNRVYAWNETVVLNPAAAKPIPESAIESIVGKDAVKTLIRPEQSR